MTGGVGRTEVAAVAVTEAMGVVAAGVAGGRGVEGDELWAMSWGAGAMAGVEEATGGGARGWMGEGAGLEVALTEARAGEGLGAAATTGAARSGGNVTTAMAGAGAGGGLGAATTGVATAGAATTGAAGGGAGDGAGGAGDTGLTGTTGGVA